MKFYLSILFFSLYFLFTLTTNTWARCSIYFNCSQNDDCESCCDGYDHCTYTCNKSVTPTRCAWSVGNTCTNWCDNGPCLYYDNVNPPGCYKNQICCSGHYYDTRVVACSCDGGGGSTSTPAPEPKCTIQGIKVVTKNFGSYITNDAISPASSQIVSLNNGSQTRTENPYYFTSLSPGNYTVSVPNIPGYRVGYSVCTNRTNCHASMNNIALDQNSWTGNCPGDGYVDLWFHYIPCLSCSELRSYSVVPNPVLPGRDVSISCDFGRWADNITLANPPFTSAHFVGFSGTAANFTATIPFGTATGTYNACALFSYRGCGGAVCNSPFNIVGNCQCTTPISPTLVAGETRNNVVVSYLSYFRNPTLTSSNTSFLTLNPASFTSSGTSPAQAITTNLVASQNVESTTVVNINTQAQPYYSGAQECNCNLSVLIVPGKFWQAINGDVIAAGSIRSLVPQDNYFLLKPGNTANDTPGIAFYGTSIDTGQGSVSEKGWKVNSNITGIYSSYNYSYFESKAPSEVRTKWGESPPQGLVNNPANPMSLSGLTTGNNSIFKDGYYWTKVNGNLQISSSSNFNQKLVLFVNGDVMINGDISLGTSGFLMIIASGNISIMPDVTRVDGIFITNGSFSTGTRGLRLDNQLKVNGTVVANSFLLQRSLPANIAQSTSAELFEYRPNLVLSMPFVFYRKTFNWREVNP